MKAYTILILLLFVNSAHADITVDEKNNHLFFGDRIEYYKDSDHLQFHELLEKKPDWRKSSIPSLNFGLKKSTYWIKFNIINKTNHDLYLTFNTINLDLIHLYIVDKQGKVTEKTGGTDYPFNHREVYDKDTFFVIPGNTCCNTIYVSFDTDYLMIFSPEIMTSDKVNERTIKVYLPYFVSYGILLALILYNLFIYLSSKEKPYLIFVFHMLCIGLYDLGHDKIGFMLFWPESLYFEDIVIPFSVGLYGVFTGYFLQLILETKQRYKAVHLLIGSFMITCGTMALLVFFININVIMTLLFLNVFYLSLCIILSLFYLVFFKKNRAAVFLLIAFMMASATDILASMIGSEIFIKNIPLLNNYLLMVFIMKFGRVWVVVMFSLVLADKINIMKKNLEVGEETYRSIFNGANEAIYILDTENFRITDANDSMLRMFQMRLDEVIGNTVDHFSSTEDGYTNHSARKYYEALLDGNFKPFEWLCKKRNGEKFWAEVNISDVRIKGEKKIMVVVRDIEDRKKAEEEKEKMLNQLTQSQKMEAVASLSGGLAHDFNNFLTGILGSSSLLEEHAKEKTVDNEIISKYTGIITRASIKASDTVRRLLTLTKKQELKFKRINLNILLKNVVEICMNSFPKSVIMEIDYFDGSAVVNADSSGLEQVFLNVLVNASHALTIMKKPEETEGGTISIQISRIYADDSFCSSMPDAMKDMNYFSVSIHDNGCGIDENIINKIFDPFFSTKGEDGGTGLGLSMVYSIIRQHYGMIKVYSEKDEGTTFTVYLPEVMKKEVPEAEEADLSKKWHGNILIIDDEDFIREIAKDILIKSGYEVYTAASGQEGIDFFTTNKDKIDAVLLDTSMPGLSGLDTFKELKKIKPTLKVIMSSGLGADERTQTALNLGADMFIQKPYTNIQLSNAVYELLKDKKES